MTSLGWLKSKTLRTLVLDNVTGLRSVKSLGGVPSLRRLVVGGKNMLGR